MPEDLAWVGFLLQDGTGRTLRSTGLSRFDAERPLPNPFPELSADGLTLFLVGFSESDLSCVGSIEEATLARDPLLLASPGDALLPGATFIARGTTSGGHVSLEVTEASLALTTDWLAKRHEDPCHAMSFTLDIVPDVNAVFGIALDPGRALVGTMDGQLVELTQTTSMAAGTFEHASRVEGGFVDGAKNVWLYVGGEGVFLRAAASPNFARVADAYPEHPKLTPRQISEVRSRSSGGDVEGGVEMFTVTQDGRFFRFHWDAARGVGVWTLLADERYTTRTSKKGGVVRLGPGRALAVVPSSRKMMRWEDGQPDRLVIEDVARAPHNVAIAAGEILAAADDGVLLRRDREGAWRELTQVAVSDDTDVIAAFGEGLLFGGAGGSLGAHHARLGPCSSARSVGSKDLDWPARLGADLLLVEAGSGRLLRLRPTATSTTDACER